MELDGPGPGLLHELALTDGAERLTGDVRAGRVPVQTVEQVGELRFEFHADALGQEECLSSRHGERRGTRALQDSDTATAIAADIGSWHGERGHIVVKSGRRAG